MQSIDPTPDSESSGTGPPAGPAPADASAPTQEFGAPEAAAPAANPLEQIVDDIPPMDPWIEWAANELASGRSLASILPDLKAAGWSDADAEEIAEQARVATRHLRGGVSRDKVAAATEQEYRNSMGRARSMGIFGGVGLAIGVAAAALQSLYRSLHRRRPIPHRMEEGIDDAPAKAVAERLETAATESTGSPQSPPSTETNSQV